MHQSFFFRFMKAHLSQVVLSAIDSLALEIAPTFIDGCIQAAIRQRGAGPKLTPKQIEDASLSEETLHKQLKDEMPSNGTSLEAEGGALKKRASAQAERLSIHPQQVPAAVLITSVSSNPDNELAPGTTKTPTSVAFGRTSTRSPSIVEFGLVSVGRHHSVSSKAIPLHGLNVFGRDPAPNGASRKKLPRHWKSLGIPWNEDFVSEVRVETDWVLTSFVHSPSCFYSNRSTEPLSLTWRINRMSSFDAVRLPLTGYQLCGL